MTSKTESIVCTILCLILFIIVLPLLIIGIFKAIMSLLLIGVIILFGLMAVSILIAPDPTGEACAELSRKLAEEEHGKREDNTDV
jgi:hypothetical protein